MDDTAKRQAEESTEKALRAGPFSDFRTVYRERLRWLKEARPGAFATALEHYDRVLLPNVLAGADAVREWVDYGQRLGELAGPGKLVRIDDSGRAHPFDGRLEGLIVHLPDDPGVPALSLAVPREPSAAQQAALDLLVR